MKRPFIEIDEEKCNGCGECIQACAEGALELRDGKAKVVGEALCDGLGACLGHCPQGALRVVEREVAAFDEHAVAARRSAPKPPAIFAPLPGHHGCPGSQARSLAPARPAVLSGGLPPAVQPSDLGQWPVMLHLVPLKAPFYQGKPLALMASCSAFASADAHWRFMRGRSVAIACPKLDDTRPYSQKLADILASNDIPTLQVVRMEVPCCGGLTRLALQAAALSGRQDLTVEETILSVDGQVVQVNPLS